jgi:hypothetical protein
MTYKYLLTFQLKCWSDDELRSGQTRDYGICRFSPNTAELRSKSTDWQAPNQDNVSEWGDISIRGLLFQATDAVAKVFRC